MSRGDEYKPDNDKIMWDLLPYEAIEKIAEVLTYGCSKHLESGWKSTPDFNNRYLAAMMRHMAAWRRGEDIDSESKLSHLAHMATNALFLLWKETCSRELKQKDWQGDDCTTKLNRIGHIMEVKK